MVMTSEIELLENIAQEVQTIKSYDSGAKGGENNETD